MELELLRRYGGLLLGTAVAFILIWRSSRSRIASTLGVQHRTRRQLVWMGLAMFVGLAVAIFVLERTERTILLWLGPAGLIGVIVLAGIQAHRHPELPLPRTDLLLRWSVPIAVTLIALGLATRVVFGPGVVFGIVGGLALGLLPGVFFLALFTLVVWLARSRRT